MIDQQYVTRDEYLSMPEVDRVRFGKDHVWSDVIQRYMYAPTYFVEALKEKEREAAKDLALREACAMIAEAKRKRRRAKTRPCRFISAAEMATFGTTSESVPRRLRGGDALFSPGASYLEVRKGVCGAYIVEAVGMNIVKIGMSSDVRGRLSKMGQAIPFDLVVLAVIPAADRASARSLEAALHERFAAHRQRPHAEWFHKHDDIVKFAESIDPRGAAAAD